MEEVGKIFCLARLLDNTPLDEDDEKENVELEFRFRHVDKSKFMSLYEYAKNHYKKIDEYSYTETRMQLLGKSKSVHRKVQRANSKKIIESKTSIDIVHLDWLNVVVSLEKKMDSMRNNIVRPKSKRRISFDIGKMRLDMTFNHEDDTYQIEVEVLDIYCDYHEVMNVVEILIMRMLDTPLYIRRSVYECVVNIASKEYGDEYFCIGKRRYQTPKTLRASEFHTIYKDEYYITPKLDGERRFLILFNDQCYSIDSLMRVRRESIFSGYSSSACCILDCEYTNETYNVIDIPVLEGEYFGGNGSPKERLQLFQERCSHDNGIVMKVYEVLGRNPYDKIMMWKEEYDIDGIVIIGRSYDSSCLKIKFNVTVDLYVNVDKTLISSDEVVFDVDIEGECLPESVYEFVVLSKDKLRVMRERKDKPVPNSSQVIISNMSSDVADMKMFQGKCSIMMRKMHNRVKRLMYRMADTERAIVLDIGTGQGGDLSKWKGVKEVIAVDPNDDLRREFEKRVSHLHKDISISHLQHRTSSYHEIIRSMGKKKANIVSLFFCLNLFEEDDITGLYEIIRRCSHNNCRIVGIYMNPDSYGSNECYDIRDLGHGNYFVEFKGTRIKQNERMFDFGSFKSHLEALGYTMMFRSKVNTMMHNLSVEEESLTNMFYSFEFRRKVGEWWMEKRSSFIECPDSNIGRIILDGEYRVLGIKHSDSAYYFERNGKILQHEAREEEIEMSKMRMFF